MPVGTGVPRVQRVEPVPPLVRSTVLARLRERGVLGLAIAGFDRHELRFAEGFGVADRERGEPVTPATVFRVASISKLLTTALVLRGVDRGGLDLDAPVNRSLEPELQIAGVDGSPAASSLRSLLTHTSGIGFGIRGVDPGNRVVSRLVNGGRLRSLPDAIAGLRLAHEPGGPIVYSNPAFNVLGHVAARRCGMGFEDAARQLVLDPLAMADSAFASDRRGPGVATPYGSIAPPGVSSEPADAMRVVATPMGGLTTTVADLARFGRMVLGGGELDGQRIVSPELLRTATSLLVANHPALDQGYGLGFKVRRWRGRTLVGHDGNMPGVATQLLVSLDDGVGVVVLTNGYPLGVPHELALLALEQLLGLEPEARPGSPQGVADAGAAAWEAAGRRIEGRFGLLDSAPPGPLGRAMERLVRIRVAHLGGGRLAVEGNPAADGPMWLEPDGEPGCYRAAAAVDAGTRAVVEERPDGVHLWLGHTLHLHRRA